MNSGFTLLVAALCLLTAPLAAQIYAAQANPTSPIGYSITTFTPSPLGAMQGGPTSRGILGVCNAYSTSQTIRVWCGHMIVLEVGLLSGECYIVPSPPGTLWPNCEESMTVTMSEPPSGPNILVGHKITVDGY